MEIKTIAKKLGVPKDQLLRRADGRIEWLCEHGIGHTVWHPPGSDFVHGCDRCCVKLKNIKEVVKLSEEMP